MKMKEFGPPGGARVPGAPLRSANANFSQLLWLHGLVTKNGDELHHCQTEYLILYVYTVLKHLN